MIRKSVASIIEVMGFEWIDEHYEAKFIDDATGCVIKFIAGEKPDKNGLLRLWFYGYDENNNILGRCTLDQMLTACDEKYMRIPEKSNKKYACVCSLRVQVPLDMNEVDEKTYYEHICSDEEIEIAREIACHQLKDLFLHNTMNVLDFEFDTIQEVK